MGCGSSKVVPAPPKVVPAVSPVAAPTAAEKPAPKKPEVTEIDAGDIPMLQDAEPTPQQPATAAAAKPAAPVSLSYGGPMCPQKHPLKKLTSPPVNKVDDPDEAAWFTCEICDIAEEWKNGCWHCVQCSYSRCVKCRDITVKPEKAAAAAVTTTETAPADAAPASPAKSAAQVAAEERAHAAALAAEQAAKLAALEAKMKEQEEAAAALEREEKEKQEWAAQFDEREQEKRREAARKAFEKLEQAEAEKNKSVDALRAKVMADNEQRRLAEEEAERQAKLAAIAAQKAAETAAREAHYAAHAPAPAGPAVVEMTVGADGGVTVTLFAFDAIKAQQQQEEQEAKRKQAEEEEEEAKRKKEQEETAKTEERSVSPAAVVTAEAAPAAAPAPSAAAVVLTAASAASSACPAVVQLTVSADGTVLVSLLTTADSVAPSTDQTAPPSLDRAKSVYSARLRHPASLPPQSPTPSRPSSPLPNGSLAHPASLPRPPSSSSSSGPRPLPARPSSSPRPLPVRPPSPPAVATSGSATETAPSPPSQAKPPFMRQKSTAEEESAAQKLQAMFRGHMARKRKAYSTLPNPRADQYILMQSVTIDGEQFNLIVEEVQGTVPFWVYFFKRRSTMELALEHTFLSEEFDEIRAKNTVIANAPDHNSSFENRQEFARCLVGLFKLYSHMESDGSIKQVLLYQPDVKVEGDATL